MTNRQAAVKTIKQLRRSGFEALLAGGCVRDMLLGRAAKDFDVATDAQPRDVARLFKRTLKVGARFGVVIVLLEDKQVEVATFRTETGYADGRHPTKVKFAGPAEDARRRDFTINGMFYDPIKREVIDYVGGQADLEKGIVRTIGAPEERFGEDYLRMLRAVRFSTQLGFKIQPRTKSAICSGAKNMTRISGERIAMELEGILVDPNRAAGARLLCDTGLSDAVFPGLTGEQAQAAVHVLARLRKKVGFALALAGFFSGCPTDFALEKCRLLKLSRTQTRHIRFLLTNRGRLLDDRMSLARLKLILAEAYFWDLYELQRAIQKADRVTISPLIRLRRRIRQLGDIELKPKPLLTGHDLIRLGAVPGPTLGQLAEEMYIAQLEGQLQRVSDAENWVLSWLERHKTE
ncbi:MAG: CCA tRNA nucleotidyltransferase [Planctomycetota bacterium]|jgi:poly(A) polymerase